ncbi:toxin-antitoxin system HicB family antitoxin [Lactobacillus helveticus]|uniref:toxin-antitoxin system HicB family antitoxin n=1 Tax=Lactobacillus helveticus TaxID=1587 RepID=UPI0015636120
MIECSESILTSIDVFVVINILSNRSKWTFIFYKVFKLILQSANKKYSGKLLVRMPKSLHAHLAEEADEENVSLNLSL